MDYIIPKSGRLWKNKADFFRPFRAAASEAGENIIPLYDPNVARLSLDHEPDLKDLNTSLAALAEVFPDVQAEVFREMLIHLGEESRLQVVTEHLLQQKAKWVQGRYRAPTKLPSSTATPNNVAPASLAATDLFRTDQYKRCAKQVLYQEFKGLSHSTIKAILAEQNFSYTTSRPVLEQLQARSWRTTISGLWSKRNASASAKIHPYIIWRQSDAPRDQSTLAVRCTGSVELDNELYELFVAPAITKQRQELESTDHTAAIELNDEEATEAEALFECECCYSSVAFEGIATCDDRCHFLCLDCVRRTAKEALYGQGWARTADLGRSTLRCFSPSTDNCHGSIPADLVKRALDEHNVDASKTWQEFQDRITSENLLKSGSRLQRCPACTYAELDDTPRVELKHFAAIWQHLATRSSAAARVFSFCLVLAIPLLLPALLLLACIACIACTTIALLPAANRALHHSLQRVHKRRRGLRFTCRHPRCKQISCLRCGACPWRDPHACFEEQTTSLRTALEASATAAVKRTCPKCLLSFVKASGCNKLVCNCGYTMCYVCRQEVTHREGYAHFCQHFRPRGGRCDMCDRCDLYGDEDEEMAIKHAVKEAEKAWKERGGEKSGQGDGEHAATRAMVKAFVEDSRRERRWEVWLDAVVDALLV